MSARIVAIGCAGALALATPAWASGALEGRTWTVAEIAGTPVAGAGTLEFKGGTVAGKAACNRFRGSARIVAKSGGGTLSLGPLATTRMMCQGRMELEKALLDALAGTRGFVRDGTSVVLTGADGGPLIKLAP